VCARAVANAQVYARGNSAPLTEYFMWPREDAWELLQMSLDAKPWVGDKEKVTLLNRLTHVRARVYVCVCARACVRVCVRACVCVRGTAVCRTWAQLSAPRGHSCLLCVACGVCASSAARWQRAASRAAAQPRANGHPLLTLAHTHTHTHARTRTQIINFWTGQQEFDEAGNPVGEPVQPPIDAARAEFPDCTFISGSTTN
jgi:hypothetical protein